ncbi:MAG: hypothetical protein KDD41_12300 [Flavobacteriales bacterium]|nr:hypothetical protein [Flavobacteriales bacterium]
MTKPLLIALFLLPSLTVFSQDDLMNMLEEETNNEAKPEKVTATFKAIKLINANTIETTKKKTLDFRITHRFGNMETSNAAGKHTLYGLDNASNIRFSLDYGLTDKLSVGVGRSKTREHIDLNLKYRFLEQKEKGLPVSAAYYTNMAISPVADVPEDKFANRLSYVHQLIIASKITPGISLEVLPTFVHRNYVDKSNLHPKNNSADENDLMALGFGGRFKLTKRFALVADYFMGFSEFRDGDNAYYDALAVGVEIETGGHVFHINLSNSEGIIENDFIPNTRGSWGKEEYKLGFNISRVFTF